MKYLWDTNTAIYYLQQQLPPSAEKFIDALLNNTGRPVISAITEIELLCWKTTTRKDQEVLYNFIGDSLVIELEQPIKLKTADIRKACRIKLLDAIIAATAIMYNLSLISRNTTDFKNIPALTIINPYTL